MHLQIQSVRYVAGAQISAKKLCDRKKTIAHLLSKTEKSKISASRRFAATGFPVGFRYTCALSRQARGPASTMTPPWALAAPVALYLGLGWAVDPGHFRQSSPEPTVGKGSHGFTSSLTVSWDTTADSTIPRILGQVKLLYMSSVAVANAIVFRPSSAVAGSSRLF